jgi:hypothetical protein
MDLKRVIFISNKHVKKIIRIQYGNILLEF